MPYKFKKGGAIQETGAKEIPLPLSKDNLKILLTNISQGISNYSHQDLANWCYRHLGNIIVNDLKLEDIGIDKATYEVLNNVDAQWDMYLVNGYKIEELQVMDLSKICLPKDWFQDWLNQLD
jgi:hypothetical protein